MMRTQRRRSSRGAGRPALGPTSLLVFAAGMAAMGAVGCKSIMPAIDNDGGTGSGGSGGGLDGGPKDLVTFDMSMMDKFMAGDSSGADGICAGVKSSAKLVPLDIYVLMDSSKSMNDKDSSGTDKWTDLKKAMSGFFNDSNSAGFSVALKYFPEEASGVQESCSKDSDCGMDAAAHCDQRKACVTAGTFSKTPSTLCSSPADCGSNEMCVAVQQCDMGPDCMTRNCVADPASPMPCPSDCKAYTGYCHNRDICTADNYKIPDVPFGLLPDAAGMLISSLNGHSPSGYTPTGPALTGALQAAQKRATDNPDHQVAVVLVTDGLPGAFIPGTNGNGCNPPDVPGVANLLSTGLTGKPAIPTFVIGIFGPCDLQQGNMQMPKEKLNMWAVAGGTKEAVLVDTSQDVTKQIQDAFKQVQSKVITCQYEIPKDVVGGIDYTKVNVDFTSDAMMTTQQIHNVADKGACDPNTGGWYYDVAPPKSTQIIACDKTCTDFKSAQGAQVQIEIGCGTVN